MPLLAADLAYPVMCFSQGHQMLHYARHADELTVCRAKAFNSGFYQHMEIVDRHAQRFGVQAAEKITTMGPFWGFDLLGGQTFRVALALEPLPPDSLAVLKQRLEQAMDGMEALDGHPETKRLVRNASSWAELVAQLADDYYRQY
ncbi:hypothetical protein [Hymenobacter psychrophilus]|uniref:Uncharacterized protein n=1 Tax=Hymenobacter psychrophilus TaxID=651662 RepID=A0A1H3P057_9BACT|nr:hypothetical protein [Hymenobacter psychrophilus]SDY94420.1 hypothetical protein SAMN04488069_12028 [Hymenobacter psychrophilus]